MVGDVPDTQAQQTGHTGEGAAPVVAQASTSEEAGAGQVVPVAEESKPEDPIARLERLANEALDRTGGFDGRVDELQQLIETLRTEVEGLTDFRKHCSDVVEQTADAAAAEAVSVRLQKEWLPKFEEVLKLVQGQKDQISGFEGVFAEVKAAMPLLRRLSGLESLVQRAEAAAARAEQMAASAPKGPIELAPAAVSRMA